ncbi:hypothetical protein SASPL_127397 [Salvia splendens]|uniref:Uncharacterized protein n=1 Tax=Salvia splendens TaxID=180675 RepID=A0A8X8X9K4_SALSN|nr:hypothetical protein SASPL_127397 [Salvia splendens]
MESLLVRMCIDAATESAVAVDKWRTQRRTLERMPSRLAEALLQRRMLYPSLLEYAFLLNLGICFITCCYYPSVRCLAFDVYCSFIVCDNDEFLFGNSAYSSSLGNVVVDTPCRNGSLAHRKSFQIQDCHKINNAALWNITGMPNLKEMDLSRCSKITDAGIQHLLSLPALLKLRISETGVTADGVAVLASLRHLLLLDLGGLPVTDSALNSLQTLTKLQDLDLWGSEVYNESVISSLFEGEGQKPRLEKVNFSGATIRNISEAFEYVETSRLSFLDISNSAPQSYSFLSSMNAMTDLNLSDSGLVDGSVEHITQSYQPQQNTWERCGLMKLGGAHDEVPSFSALERLSHLETLDLELLHIKDPALRPLANMSRLMVTDTGLAAFAPPPALEILDLRGCWLLSKEFVSRFCQMHPQLEVRHNSFETLDKRKEYSSLSRATTRTPKGKNKQGSSSALPQYFVASMPNIVSMTITLACGLAAPDLYPDVVCDLH